MCWVPESSLAGVSGCHEMALALVSGLSFGEKLICKPRRSWGSRGVEFWLKNWETGPGIFSQTALRYPNAVPLTNPDSERSLDRLLTQTNSAQCAFRFRSRSWRLAVAIFVWWRAHGHAVAIFVICMSCCISLGLNRSINVAEVEGTESTIYFNPIQHGRLVEGPRAVPHHTTPFPVLRYVGSGGRAPPTRGVRGLRGQPPEGLRARRSPIKLESATPHPGRSGVGRGAGVGGKRLGKPARALEPNVGHVYFDRLGSPSSSESEDEDEDDEFSPPSSSFPFASAASAVASAASREFSVPYRPAPPCPSSNGL